MRIGWIGLGKVGLPGALVFNVRGRHDVVAYDVAKEPYEILAGKMAYPHIEEGIDELLAVHSIRPAGSVGEAIRGADLVFVCVQTPHNPEFGGDRPYRPDQTAGLDYDYLTEALDSVDDNLIGRGQDTPVVVVSTVAPGAFARLVADRYSAPILYHPWSVALGQTARSVCTAEKILVGLEDTADHGGALGLLSQAYRPIWPIGHTAHWHVVSHATAELAKMASNAWQTQQITYANQLAAIADKVGADVDQVTSFVGLGYRAGMVDGGPCRPRDLVAMADVEQRHNLADYHNQLARQRDRQTRRLALLLAELQLDAKLPIVIAGRAYKPQTDLTDGSPALLLSNILSQYGVAHQIWDPRGDEVPGFPAVYLIATRHPELAIHDWPAGSTVVDPWGIVGPQTGVAMVYPGRRRKDTP